HTNGGGFARTVGAEKAEDLTTSHTKGDLGHGFCCLEGAPQGAHLDHEFIGSAHELLLVFTVADSMCRASQNHAHAPSGTLSRWHNRSIDQLLLRLRAGRVAENGGQQEQNVP